MTTLSYEEGDYLELPDLACIFNNNERTRDTLPNDDETARILGPAWRQSTHYFSTLCEKRSFPMEWYAAVFRTTYFQNSRPEDIEVTVISTEITPRRAVVNLIASARLFFTGTKLAWLESAPYDDQINYAVNAYTGDLTFGRSTCNEFGCATLQGTPRMIARRP